MAAAKNYKTLELPNGYSPKKSEVYMCPEHRAYFYKILDAMRDETAAALTDVMNDIDTGSRIADAGAGDEVDASTVEQDADLAMRLQERNANLLKKIDSALAALENGTYGYSILSGEEIGLKRMMARPLATLTLEEQEEHEQRE
jgi:DnaK suppressor protein